MLITFRTHKFDLEPSTARYVESRLLSAIGSFRGLIESVTVTLDATGSRSDPGGVVCEIDVRLRPSGGLRSGAEHSEMQVALDRALAHVRLQLDPHIARTSSTAVPAIDIAPSFGPAMDVMFDDDRLSHLQRELLERPDNVLRPVRVRERWRSHGDVDAAPGDRAAGRGHQRSQPKRPRRSWPFSRIHSRDIERQSTVGATS
jgi:ribosome-associated translation inhibitor RaiA